MIFYNLMKQHRLHVVKPYGLMTIIILSIPATIVLFQIEASGEILTPSVEIWTETEQDGFWLYGSAMFPDPDEPDASTPAGGGPFVTVDPIAGQFWMPERHLVVQYYLLGPTNATWFPVDFEQPIIAEAVPQDPFPGGPVAITIGQPFYLGYEAGVLWSDEARYGWAKLVYDGSELVLLDSAAENLGVGIYAGTTILFPEPAGIIALSLGALAMLRRRRGVE